MSDSGKRTTRSSVAPTNSSRSSTRNSGVTKKNYLVPLPTWYCEPSIRCLSFGPDRVEKYPPPQSFFCSNCSFAQEKMEMNGRKWPNLDGKRYICTANHLSATEPQDRKTWNPSKSLVKSSSKSPKRKKTKKINENAKKPSPPPTPPPPPPPLPQPLYLLRLHNLINFLLQMCRSYIIIYMPYR